MVFIRTNQIYQGRGLIDEDVGIEFASVRKQKFEHSIFFPLLLSVQISIRTFISYPNMLKP